MVWRERCAFLREAAWSYCQIWCLRVLGQCAEQNWRKLRGFDHLAKVITGVMFKDGIEATNPDQIAA